MAEEKLLGVQRLSTVQLGKDIARANEMLKTLGSGIKIDFGESVRQQLDSVLAEIKRVAEETKRAASSASKASGSASAGTFISQIDKLASVTTNYEAATNKATSAIARGWDAAKNKVVEYKNAEGKITRRTVTDDQGAAKQSKAVAQLAEAYVNLQLEIDKLESQRGGSKSDREARQRQLNSLKQEEARLTGQIESMKRDGISNNKLETDLMNKRSQIQKDLQAKQKQQTDAQKQHHGVLQKVSDTLVRMATFAIWRTMMNAWRNATSFAKEYYDALNEIRIITKESEMSANQMGNEFIDMAKRMSVSATEIAKAAVEFYRQGLSDSEVSNRLEWTIQYAKIAGLEFSEAAELVTAATNSMDLDCQRVVDVFAYLGDASASGADEIGQAMQKASASATEAGVSFEWLGAYIATVSEKTRQTPEVIGTAFNSMMARLHNIRAKGYNEDDDTKINDVAKALDKLPEKISLINALTGEWVDMSTIFEEIARQWTNLDDKTRAYIATTMAGTRQQNVFLTLMNDMAKAGEGASRAYELYAGAMNSSGAVSEKYGIYQESVQASLDSMIASWQEFINLFNGGEVFKSFYGFFEDVITVLTEGTKATDGWNLALIGISLAIAVVVPLLVKLAVAIRGVASAWQTMDLATKTNTIGLAISAIAAVVGILMTAVQGIQSLNSEVSRIDYDKHITALESNIDRIKTLKTRYEELSRSTSLTVEEQTEMRTILEEIRNLAPAYSDALTQAQGDINASISVTNQALADQEARLRTLSALKAQQDLGDATVTNPWVDSLKSYAKQYDVIMQLNSGIFPRDAHDLFNRPISFNPADYVDPDKSMDENAKAYAFALSSYVSNDLMETIIKNSHGNTSSEFSSMLQTLGYTADSNGLYSFYLNYMDDNHLNSILPTSDPAYISGADGNWYTVLGEAIAPTGVPDLTANVYYASFSLLADQQAIIKYSTLIDIANAIREVCGIDDRMSPTEFADVLRAHVETAPTN